MKSDPQTWRTGRNMQLLHPTAKTSLILLLRLAAQGVVLLTMARLLGAANYAVLAGLSALAITMGSLATLGTHVLLLKTIVAEPERRTQALALALGATSRTATLLFIIYIVTSALSLDFFAEHFILITSVGVSELFIQPLLIIHAAELQAEGSPAKSQMVMARPLVLRALAALLLFLLSPRHPLIWFALAYLLSSLVASFHSLTCRETSLPPINSWRLPNRTELKDTLGFGLLSFTRLGPNELDKTLALHFVPSAIAGVYSASSRIIGASIIPVVALMVSTLPQLFKYGQSGTKKSITRTLPLTTFIYGVLCAGLLWLIAPLLQLLFGPSYTELGRMTRLICLAIPALSLRIALGNFLMAASGPWQRVAFELSGIVVLVITATTFHPTDLTLRMPVALIAAEWSMASIAAYFSWKLQRDRQAP